jgi:hypothetical protein
VGGGKNRETGWNIWDTKMVRRDVRSMCAQGVCESRIFS